MNQLNSPRDVFQAQSGSGPIGGADLVDIPRLFRAVLRYRWGILGFAGVLTLITGFFVYSMQPVFRATASIVLESAEANVVSVEDVYSVDTRNFNYTQTQFEILKSRSLAERVVRKLELHKHPLYRASSDQESEPPGMFSLETLLPVRKKQPPVQLTQAQKDEKAIQAITGSIVARLQVSPVQLSYIVYLSFESTDRKLAAEIVNAVAQEFIDSHLENRLAGTVQATDWLSERLEFLKQNLRQSEQALQSFRDREGLVDIEGVTGLGGSELKTLSLRLQEVTRMRIEAENIREDVEGMNSATTDELMTLPAVLEHQLIGELNREQSAVERKVAELAKRYGPMHPKMIAAQSDLKTANENLGREVRNVVSGISREYEVALRNEQQLRENWEARKSEMQEFNRVEFQLQELQREVEANRQLYDIFFTRIKSVSETGGFEKPHARIVDRALPPTRASSPNMRLSLSLALVVGLLLGCIVAIALDILDNTIKTSDDVQDKLQSPLLGTIPKMKVDKDGGFEQFWQNSQNHYAEAIRTIRTGVVLSGLDNPAKIIVVTSTVPGEGKSTTALNLGAALAQMENTLVIGADLRRPSLAKKCNLAPNHLGLSHFVSEVAQLDECIEYLDELNMHVMPAGVIPTNPLEMISSRRFKDALARLRERFDRIVIDSAPVQAVSDALILASYSDSVVYVVKADATSATQVKKGIESIVASNEPLTGVVLNQYDARKAGAHQFSDSYYQYGEYHQDKEPG